MFGGTPVTVELEQYCLNNTDTLVCTFDSTDSVAVKIIQDGSFVCPVPMSLSVGRILLRIKGTTSWEAMFTKYFNFYLSEYCIQYILCWIASVYINIAEMQYISVI